MVRILSKWEILWRKVQKEEKKKSLNPEKKIRQIEYSVKISTLKNINSVFDMKVSNQRKNQNVPEQF